MNIKTYVITGATSGIGKALIEKLDKENIIFAGYRDINKLEALKQVSPNIYPFYIDYAKPNTISSAIEFISLKTNKIDTLVNIAGCVVAGPIEKIDINEIKKQFNVNVFGHLEFAQGLITLLEGGKIINMSSMASYGIFPYISPYCASKRALDMFFNALLIENKKNVKIVSIKPGVIATPLWEKSIKENEKSIDKCIGYEKEMNFLIKNARKNSTNGLSVEKVVETILKADRTENPKLTYTVGIDAFMARFVTKLPQELLNNIIKLGIKVKSNKRNVKICK